MATGTKDAPAWSRVEGTLMSTARVVRRAYDAALAPLDINLAEASVLAYLGTSDGLTQVQVAARMGASRARVGAYIDSLEARGAVVRERDPDDRRVWKVRLTPAGEELWKEAVQVDRSVRRALRSGLSAAELDALDAMLTRVRENLESLANGVARES